MCNPFRKTPIDAGPSPLASMLWRWASALWHCPMKVGFWAAASVICATTFVVSFGAVFLGRRFGGVLRNKAELVGGLILVGIGVKIFVEHMMAG